MGTQITNVKHFRISIRKSKRIRHFSNQLKNSNIKMMYGELLKQLDEVESSVFELIQDKQATSLQLEAFEGKHRKLQADLESKEKKHNIEENCFREKLKQLEQQKLQMKVKYEERYRGFCEELKRCTAKGKIYQNEAETA